VTSTDDEILAAYKDAPAFQDVHRGQLRWADRFAAKHEGEYIHTAGRGWLAWRGSHWAQVDDAVPARAVLAIARAAFAEMPKMDSAARKDLFDDIRQAEHHNGVRGILGLAAVLPGISRDDGDLDNRPDLIAFRNHTYELLTDVVRDADPADLVTKCMGCDYDPGATCPTYDAGMEVWQPDPEMRAYIHRIGGSALQGRATEQTLPVFYGKGANGKGTTLNDSWLPAFGDYGKVMDVSVLLSRGGDSAVLQQKAELAGARLVVTSEPDAGLKFSPGTLKLLTGGNPIQGKVVYRKPITVYPSWQLVMECNTRPAPPADVDAVWRRLRQVGWDVVVPEDQRDATLPQKLADELPGIANRLLAGWRDYRDHGGIRVPAEVKTATAGWRAEVDTIGQFLDDECYRGITHSARSRAVYARWMKWCRDNGEDAGSNKAFSERLGKKDGLVKKRTAEGVRWLGIALRERADDDPDA
jgi:putative DNA primase/helicase